jgi:phosphate transport system ATP-binding protein
MDEPCAALDVSGTEGVERLIRGWRGSFTTLIVTHNMAQARRVSDYCAFMLNGELVEFGPTASIFDSPADSRTADYIAGRYG